MIRAWKTKIVFVLSLVLVSFLFLSVASLFAMSSTGGHEHCPLMPTFVVLCTMNTFDHIQIWQGLLRLRLENGFVALAAALLLLFFAAIRLKNLMDRVMSRLRVRFREPAFAYAHITPLSEAFSEGILHSKVF